MVAREKPGPPMTLANMRTNGVHAVIATCHSCGHKADVNVDALPEAVIVPEAAEGSDALTAEVRRSIRDRRGIRRDQGDELPRAMPA
jgi:hypothetical protein